MKYTLFLLGVFCVLPFPLQARTTDLIIQGAYAEVKNETRYNTEMLATYVAPTFKNGSDTGRPIYPNGDVNPKEGICADLIVRALRTAGIDLQERVHNDVRNNKNLYGVVTPDKYIDHRRVWILQTFFRRNWRSLSTEATRDADWRPGDVVIWDIGSKQHLHIGIIGKKTRPDGLPHVIHNMRYVPLVFAGKTIEQDILEGPMPFAAWKIIGHYRFKP